MASNNNLIPRFTEQCKLSWRHLRLLFQNYHDAYLHLLKSFDRAVEDVQEGWEKYRDAQPDPDNADYNTYLATPEGKKLDDRAIKIDDGGRLHTDLLKAISPTYDRKGEELVGEERWEKMVTEASEKFGGGRLVVVPIEVYEEMAKAREEKERVVEEKRATEEYEREWPLIGEGR